MHHLRKYIITIYIASFVLLLGGCGVGSTDFQALRIGDIPWGKTEITLYQITDSAGEDAGQMRITLSNIDDESRLMQREIGGIFREELAISMKANNLRPIESNLVRTHRDGIESIRAVYDGSQVNMQFTTKINVMTDERASIPSDSYDYRTIMMLLRTLPLESGYATKVNGYLPISGTLERVELVVSGTETVNVPAGTFDTWEVSMNAQSNRSTAWIGSEAPFLLVKYKDGANGATFELQSVEE